MYGITEIEVSLFSLFCFFFFNDTATTEIYTLSLHDALPISKKLDSWGFIWIFSCWLQNGLSVLPSKNLVRNVGYGSDATHTNKKDRILSNLRELEIDFPLNQIGRAHV